MHRKHIDISNMKEQLNGSIPVSLYTMIQQN